MCGIAGVVRLDDSPASIDRVALASLVRSLKHRGPDSDGIWTSQDQRVGLVHTRLSIVDLSPTGAQPMSTPDGTFTIVFNGEIYNYKELRERLAKNGVAFRGQSDTEVLLHLYVALGSRCVDELDGMFAFAIWNARDKELFCARDHLGEKPLYYARTRHCFAFSSEVRALVQAGIVAGSPDLRGIGFLLSQGSIPPPYTHIEQISLLDPGSWLSLRAGSNSLEKRRYWSIPFRSESEAIQDPRLATEMAHEVLRRSVRRRLRADVPVGAFLSSGIDSSLVVALMRDQGASDLRTFTVTLPGQRGDETEVARDTARRLGTDHYEIPLHLGSDTGWLDQAIADMDVPSVDGPNTWLVSRAVREAGAKVACSGLGGDELFYGYPTFSLIPRLARWRLDAVPGYLPLPIKLSLLRSVPPVPRWSRFAEAILASGSIAALWYAKRSLMSDCEIRELLVEGASCFRTWEHLRRVEALACPPGLASEREVSFLELSVYMHDQLLRDTDQMSMAHALEVRVPLIGREVVETVASFGHGALAGEQPKSVLRSILRGYLPDARFGGPKRGFTLNWQELLLPSMSKPPESSSGLFRKNRVHHIWKRFFSHRSGFGPPFLIKVLEAHAHRFRVSSSFNTNTSH